MDNLSFWGIFLVLTGAALIVRVIFNIEFPVLRVLFGLFLILMGFRILFGNLMIWPVTTGENEIIFRSATVDASVDMASEYQIAFSKAGFYLGDMEHPEKKQSIRINSVFSGCTIYLPPGLPVKIVVEAVFAGVKMPSRNTPVFGKGSYISEDYDPERPHLDILVNVVFGSVTLMYEP